MEKTVGLGNAKVRILANGGNGDLSLLGIVGIL